VVLNYLINFSSFISWFKIPAVTSNSWSPTNEDKTCGTNALDSARLVRLDWTGVDSAGVYAFPRRLLQVSQIVSATSFWVWLDCIGLDSTTLVGAHPYNGDMLECRHTSRFESIPVMSHNSCRVRSLYAASFIFVNRIPYYYFINTRSLTYFQSDDTRCCDNTICPPEDGHVKARNMSRVIM